jgi:hypothetical protein
MLAVRVLRHQLLELGDDRGRAAEVQIRVDASFECGEAKLIELGPLRLGMVQDDAGERTAAPEAKCLAKLLRCCREPAFLVSSAGVLDEPPEACGVDLVAVTEPQDVARSLLGQRRPAKAVGW